MGFDASCNWYPILPPVPSSLITSVGTSCASQKEIQDVLQSFFGRAQISDQTQRNAVAELVRSAFVNGWWDKCDIIYPFVGGTALAHSMNLKSADFTITWSGTVTHDANGITGNGTSGRGDTGYVPSAGANFSLNSAHLGLYRRTVGTNVFAGVSDGTTNQARLGILGANIRFALNNLSTLDGSGLSSSLGPMMASRLSSSNYNAFVQATSQVISRTSNNRPTNSLLVLAHSNNGTPALFSTVNLAFATCGSGMTFAEYQTMAADWQTFQTTLGRQV